MKKEDLKTGMLTQNREGNVYLVIGNSIVRSEIDDSLSYFRDDLTSNYDYKEFDIVKVSKVLDNLIPSNWTIETLNANLLWEREEVPEYVEVLSNIYDQHIAVGETCKVESVTESGCYNLIANKIGSKKWTWTYTAPSTQLKPSTKEAYEEQFKVNERTIEELEKLTGLTNLKIKK